MHRIEIIAEAGINHNGNISTAIEMIRIARQVGANCIKFQLYDPSARPDIETHPYKEILIQSRLTNRDVYLLKDEADRQGIEFMASAFDLKRLGWLNEIDVKRYKIASKSIYDIKLIEAIQKTGKPYLVSMGLLGEDITDEVLYKYGIDRKGEKLIDTWERLGYKKNPNASFLYCNFSYPTKLEDIDMTVDNFDYYDGFSDHTIGITASVVAMVCGARIIEKHVTMDKMAQGPDHAMSISFDELKMLCSMRNDIEQIRLYDNLYLDRKIN